MRILVVEDEKPLADAVARGLRREGMAVDVAYDGESGQEKASITRYDVIVLDRDLPGMSGDEVCRQVVGSGELTRVIMLTASDSVQDRVEGLSLGADDYLAKPFSFAELSARVKALLRRYCIYQGKAPAEPHHPKPDDQMLELHGVRIALDCNRVWVDEQEADLTETEYKILKLLMQSPQRIFPVQVIYETVWGEPYFYVSNGTVMVHIRNLRMKVEHNPQNPQRICTVWGKGYRFAAQEDGNGNT